MVDGVLIGDWKKMWDQDTGLFYTGVFSCAVKEVLWSINSPNFTSSQIGNFKMGKTFSFYFAEKQHEL